MYLTKNKIEWAYTIYEHLISTAIDYFKVWEIENPDKVELVGVTPTTIKCRYIIEAGYNSDLNDREYELTFPIEYLWSTEDWISAEQGKKFKKNLADIEARKQAHLANLARQEQKDRELYLQLKSRFEDDSTTQIIQHKKIIDDFVDEYTKFLNDNYLITKK